MSDYVTEHDAIVKTMQHCIDGVRAGRSDLMRLGFHPDASFIGFAGGMLYDDVQQLFDWIDQNGPVPDDRLSPQDFATSKCQERLKSSLCYNL